MGGVHPASYHYGFSKQNSPLHPRLVWVESCSDECDRDCGRSGLVTQHAICWDTLWTWDDVPRHEEHSVLGPGITKFWVCDLPYDLANWMSNLPNELFLWQLALPGSHDSGTAQSVPFTRLYVRTQAFSIINQLILGIRVFDIRPTRAGNGVGREDGGIWTNHGGYKGERLSRAVTCVKMFLEAYPSETAIFIVSHCENVHERAVYDEIRSVCNDRGILFSEGSFFTSDQKLWLNKLTLGQCRGKLIVINESNAERNLGPNGHDGTQKWSAMLDHITNIHPPKMPPPDTQPASNQYFQRFIVALTGDFTHLPCTLAASEGLPGLRKWLKTDDSNKIGIVEADWFGSGAEVKDLVALIVDKNKERSAAAVRTL